MKSFKVIAISLALVFSLAVGALAFSKLTTRVFAKTGESCCQEKASCCQDGAACCDQHAKHGAEHKAEHKTEGSCCAKKESCPLKAKAQTQTENASYTGVPVTEAGAQSCHQKQAAAGEKKECCGSNASCCDGGSCCQAKTEKTAKL